MRQLRAGRASARHRHRCGSFEFPKRRPSGRPPQAQSIPRRVPTGHRPQPRRLPAPAAMCLRRRQTLEAGGPSCHWQFSALRIGTSDQKFWGEGSRSETSRSPPPSGSTGTTTGTSTARSDSSHPPSTRPPTGPAIQQTATLETRSRQQPEPTERVSTKPGALHSVLFAIACSVVGSPPFQCNVFICANSYQAGIRASTAARAVTASSAVSSSAQVSTDGATQNHIPR